MADIGEKVQIHCVQTLDDGRCVMDTHRASEPLTVTVGKSTFPPLIERELYMMMPGDKRSVRLAPEQAFGVYDEGLVQHVPANLLPNADKLPVGGKIQLRTRAGLLDATVVSASADEVVLDCNHEFAGKSVQYDLELVSIVHDSAIHRELHPEGCACGCDKLKAQIG